VDTCSPDMRGGSHATFCLTSGIPAAIIREHVLHNIPDAMSRPRLWQERPVLDAALAVFREKGYERTSLRDVEGATGLGNGSLYKAYASKAGLFRSVLEAYNERVVRARIERHISRAGDPLLGLQAFFNSTFEDLPMPDPGCLVTNSAIEAPALDEQAREAIAGGLDAITEAFAGALSRAGAAGDIPRDAPIEQLARRLLALYQGLLVLVRFGRPTEELAAVAEAIPAIVGQHGSRA
jgi:AcrR family transcriptional regulator